MLIINADDWGGWQTATDAALACFQKGRISSVTAMVFMKDSARAAALAKEAGMDVGLHLNLNLPFTGAACPDKVRALHRRVCHWLRFNKLTQLIYNPFLSSSFRHVYEAQVQEFIRLYGRPPSHVDGHQHMHLCANMLFSEVIPRGQRVRRNFSFWPGEKSRLNRAYRQWVDRRLARRYRLTDYFFALSQCLRSRRTPRVEELAKTSNVELMTHPQVTEEYEWLAGEAFLKFRSALQLGGYATL